MAAPGDSLTVGIRMGNPIDVLNAIASVWIVPLPIITQTAPWVFHLACERLLNQSDRHMTKKHQRSVAKGLLRNHARSLDLGSFGNDIGAPSVVAAA